MVRRRGLLSLRRVKSLRRFYTARLDPIFFDTSTMGRFNAPDASYGVLSREIVGVFAETFLRKPGRSLIDPDLLLQKGVCPTHHPARP